MASYPILAVAVIAVLATSCEATSLRRKRQVNNNNSYFQCPGDGPFPNQADCSTFFQCFQGRASLLSCASGLEFNPANGWCDYPANVNSNCQRTASSAINNVCLANRGDISGVYYVAHPGYCNAFFTCGDGRVFTPCIFCGGGQIFNPATGVCESIIGVPDGQVNSLCGSRTFIQPQEQTIRRLDASCNLVTPNPYQALYDKITQNGGLYNQQVQNANGAYYANQRQN